MNLKDYPRPKYAINPILDVVCQLRYPPILKLEHDNAIIGLLLCKSKDKVVAEYALGDKTQPMGIAEYKLQQSLPEPLETSLPSIEQIERELQEMEGGANE